MSTDTKKCTPGHDASVAGPSCQTQLSHRRHRSSPSIGARLAVALVSCGLLLVSSGCSTFTTTSLLALDDYEIPKGQFNGLTPPVVDENGVAQVGPQRPPAELSKVSLPDYVIEPPDVLLIQEWTAAPNARLQINPQDTLQVVVLGAPPDRPIAGLYQVEIDGFVNLGPGYGKVKVVGMTP